MKNIILIFDLSTVHTFTFSIERWYHCRHLRAEEQAEEGEEEEEEEQWNPAAE